MLPHQDVYARLAPSPIHGIGVFAIWDIPEGARVFDNPPLPLREVSKEIVDGLQAPYRRLYEDFCVLEEQAYHSPSSFNLINVAWYLNHSERPNIAYGPGSAFYALRPIRAGEELTADYQTFSPSPLPWTR